MAFAWSRKALREQIEINRIVQAIASDPSLLNQLGLLATPVIAVDTIAPGQSGKCEFQEGSLEGKRRKRGERVVMWNIVSGSTITAGQEALAQRVMLPGGEGGWVVTRSNASLPGGTEYACDDCSTGKMPSIRLSISNLRDLTSPDDNTYDGWAGVVNGTHELRHDIPFSQCSPGIEFTVPDNRGNNGSPGIEGKFALQVNGANATGLGGAPAAEQEVLQPLTSIWFWQGDDINTRLLRTIFKEQSTGVGYMSRVDGKVVCDQTYKNYALHVDEAGGNFATWLGNGRSAGDEVVFEINP